MKDKRIAVISELTLHSVNYGNRLQAFALNWYLSKHLHFSQVDSVILDGFRRKEQNKYTSIRKALFKKVVSKVAERNKNNGRNNKSQSIRLLAGRFNEFDDFLREHSEFSVRAVNYNGLFNSDYDVFIVGSDVVWSQVLGRVNKIKFLDFKTQKEFRRISYAASFSREYFPKENRRYVRQCLEKFDAISVRDRFSMLLLEKIGIRAKLVCDPTLLLLRKEWEKMAVTPVVKEKYIFVYLLGKNKDCRKKITKLAKDLGLKIVTIPYADGIYDGEENFGDYRLNDCGPEEWVGLVQNAEYVLTDSFHGLMFATIFEKKFLVVKKKEDGKSAEEHPPARMIDFLETINETDKYIPVPDAKQLARIVWNYQKINKNIDEFRKMSIEYLKDNLL